jgi:NO-binding membrane sensor protein with MHYT domain
MHYLDMLAFELPVSVQYDWPTATACFLAAMRLPAMCHYSTTLVALSVLIAIRISPLAFAARLPPSRRYPLVELAEVR